MTETNIIDRLFGWWYRIAAPPEVANDAPDRIRERVRRARFLSIILLLEFLSGIFDIVQSNNSARTIIITFLVIEWVCIILNRFGKVMASGILVLIIFEIAIPLGLIGSVAINKGLGETDLIPIISLIYPDMIAITIFPTLVALIFVLVNIFGSLLLLIILPKDPALMAFISAAPLSAYSETLSPQFLVIMIGFLWASNTQKEEKRANQAEEVNKLTIALAGQQQDAIEEKQRLEESIQQIVNVHMQVANGDFNARVPLDNKNVLWSVAGSLNNLLSRMQRWQHELQIQQRVAEAIQYATNEIRQARRQNVRPHVTKTGTMLDLLLTEVNETLASQPAAASKPDNMAPIASKQIHPPLAEENRFAPNRFSQDNPNIPRFDTPPV